MSEPTLTHSPSGPTSAGPLLEGRTILITGAARGIGRAVASACAVEGARLVLVDSGADVDGQGADDSVVQGAAAELRAGGVDVEGLAQDVCEPGALDRCVAVVLERFGRLDGFVHAAGAFLDRSVLRVQPEALDRVLAVQLGAAFAAVRVAGQVMVERKEGGSIVLFSGPSAFFGARGHAAMGAAQAGVAALARSAALELRRHRVRVNAVCPTARTRQTEALPTFAAIDEASMSAAHVASVVTFLLSDLAQDVHGETVGVAGSRVYAIRSRETTGAFGAAKPLGAREVHALWPRVIEP